MADRLPSGRWRLRYRDVNGKRQTASFATEAEADAFGDKQRTAVREGMHVAPQTSKIKFKVWAIEFFSNEVVRRGTQERDEHYYRNHVEPKWGGRSLDTITRREIVNWITFLHEPGRRVDGTAEPLAPATVEKIYILFHKILQGAVEAEVIGRNPCPGKPALRKGKNKAVRFLTAGEVEHLASFVDPYFRLAVYLMAYAGLRIGELAALRVNDLNLLRKTIRVDEGVTVGKGGVTVDLPKSDRAMRTIPLADRVLDMAKAHVDAHAGWADPDAFIFEGPKGGVLRPNNWRPRFFDPAVVKADLSPLTPHDLRHTAASFFIAEGANQWMVAELLGHADTRMIDRIYGHLFEEDREALRERLSERANRAASQDNIVSITA